jgi:hypothetical protein
MASGTREPFHVSIVFSDGEKTGAESRTRTDDLLITNQLLYQLSYFGLLFDCIVAALEGKVHPKPRVLPTVIGIPSSKHRRGELMNILAQTLQLAFRIALVWTGGFLLAVAVNALLPDKIGLTLYGRADALLVPFNRIGFWTCLLAAVTVTALVVLRAMAADLGWRSFQ